MFLMSFDYFSCYTKQVDLCHSSYYLPPLSPSLPLLPLGTKEQKEATPKNYLAAEKVAQKGERNEDTSQLSRIWNFLMSQQIRTSRAPPTLALPKMMLMIV